MFRRSFRKTETPNLEYESSEIMHNEDKARKHQKLKNIESGLMSFILEL